MITPLSNAYQQHIVETHKQPLFLLLVGFISSFAFIRFSVRMIRAKVRWWPGNITPGGLHIHHMVFGLGFLLLGGITVVATDGGHPWLDWGGLSFGIGCGLVLDEFALILHLDDVYWSEQGRKSVDAVIIGILITALLLTGYVPLGIAPGQDEPLAGRWGLVAVISVNALMSVVALLKGKTWTGMLGIMIPGLSWIGAVRLARAGSPWAHWLYAGRPRREERADRRERLLHTRADRARTWLFDLIAGAPDKVPAHHAATHRVAERMAAKATAHLDAHNARALARRKARLADRLAAGRPAGGRRTGGSAAAVTGAVAGAVAGAAGRIAAVDDSGNERQAGARRRRRTVRAGRHRVHAARTGSVHPPARTTRSTTYRHPHLPHPQPRG